MTSQVEEFGPDLTGAAAPAGPPLAAAAFVSPWHRSNMLNTALVLALFGFCFAFFPALSVLFNDLVRQGRFELEAIGVAYTIIILSNGGASLIFGMVLKMERNRKTLFWSFIAMGVLFLAMRFASGNGILVLCALLGLPLGAILSIAFAALVTFGEQAVRVQGFVSISMRGLQLAATVVLSGFIVPHFAAAGGFTFIAAIYFASAPIWLLFFVDRFPATAKPEGSGGRLGIGWYGAFALLAALFLLAGRGALLPYIVPLGELLGLDSTSAGQGLSVFVAGQLVGAVVVTIFTFGGRYIPVLTVGAALVFASSFVSLQDPSKLIFYVCLFALAGAFAIKDVFVLPMIMSADPSMRAARMSGSAILFGEAFGPLVAGALLMSAGVRGAIFAACGLTLLGMLLVYGVEALRGRKRV